MLKTLWATVRQGKVELLDLTELPEGSRVLVKFLPDDEVDFWLKSSQTSLNAIWDTALSSNMKYVNLERGERGKTVLHKGGKCCNTEDDVYAQLRFD
ncbi:hypothetical protein [Chamaesiphon sp. VAR_48_metabat_135_sub]|uniref:hypothetical protein n=1 Tax=Chamaesiphon sp. VAR_48_metabat_135_sub TaxID=2964699 RepID=UPI0037BF27B8